MQQFRTISTANPLGCLLTVLLLTVGLVVLIVIFAINLVLSLFGLKLPLQKWLMSMIFPGSGQMGPGSQTGSYQQTGSSQNDTSSQQGRAIDEPDESEYVDFKEIE